MTRLLASLLLLFGTLASTVHAGQDLTEGLTPVIPGAIGPGHPEGNAFWRANHMKLLVHDRDMTVREGERDIEASLKQCVTCHATKGPDATPLPINAKGQFCAACHEFAAVKIDCFQCHSTRPDVDTAKLLLRKFPEDKDISALVTYLDGVSE